MLAIQQRKRHDLRLDPVLTSSTSDLAWATRVRAITIVGASLSA
ncbi:MULTISPECIES: hypothetical protein [Paraburkholderia]|nr:hypothetical protein [Paraburkholderia sp. WSM4179]